jgi:hypothetical protein
MKAVDSISDLQPCRQSLPGSSGDQRSKEKRLMTSRMGQQQSDDFLTIRNAWMEGKAPIPCNPVSIYETNMNVLLGLLLGKGTSILLGLERGADQPLTIINKLSGKALDVENASISQAARIHQVTRNGDRISDGSLNARNSVNTWPFQQ